VKKFVVRLELRVRLSDGSRPCLDPVLSANGKVKPLYAAVDGKAETSSRRNLLRPRSAFAAFNELVQQGGRGLV